MTAPSTTFYIKQGDTSPIIVEYLRNADGTALDLTAAIGVAFHLLAADGTVKVNAAATILDATNGKVQYAWSSSDTNTAGAFTREWQCTLASGRIVTVPNNDNYPVLIAAQIA